MTSADHGLLSVGDTYADIVTWKWDRISFRFTSEVRDADFTVQFHKRGGRWSAGEKKSYWTMRVDGEGFVNSQYEQDYQSADQAKRAAVAHYKLIRSLQVKKG